MTREASLGLGWLGTKGASWPRMRRESWIATGMLLLFVLAHIPTLPNTLAEDHAFRQTQTAYTTLLFARDGIDLLRPPLPVLGPPWTAPMEFPLFQAVASFLVGPLGSDAANRTAALAFFVLASVAVFGLARRLRAGSELPALACFLLTPIALILSRASLIEYLPVAAIVGAAWASIRWRDEGQTRDWLLATVLAAIAMMVKITTGTPWLLFLLLVSWSRGRFRAAALVLVPFVAGLAWTHWADGIKAASPSTQFLTSWALMTWNFGTVGQRLSLGAWGRMVPLAVEAGAIVVIVAAVPFIRWAMRHTEAGLGLAAAAFAGPLMFMNLYVIHEYYWIEASAGLALIVGIGLADAARRWFVMAGVAVALTLVITFPIWIHAWIPSVDPHGDLAIAAQIKVATRPDEWVAVVGRDWDSTILYYADRRGYAVHYGQHPNLNGYHVFEVLPGTLRVVDEGVRQGDTTIGG